MNISIRDSRLKWISCCLAALFVSTLSAEPLFDTHLHYNTRDAERFSPQQIIGILDRNSIQYALFWMLGVQIMRASDYPRNR